MKKRIGIISVAILGVLAVVGLVYYFVVIPFQANGTFPWSGAPTSPTTQAPRTYLTAPVARASLTDTVGTTGAVRSKQSVTLIWQTTGTVGKVNGTVGQVIQDNSTLAELELTSLPTTVILAQADLVTAHKNLDTLLSSNQARANAEMALVKAEKALDDANDNRRNKMYQRASQETIDITRARLIQANDALDKAEDAFSRVSNMSQDDVNYAAGLARLAKARQDQIRAQYNLDYVVGLPDPLDIQEADAAVKVAEANVLQAKLDWERVKDGPNEQDVLAAQARVAAAQATINLARLVAPFTGTVTLANSKAGDQVTPGTVAFQLDDLTHLYIDAAVAEVDIARVKVGQSVTIIMDALPGKQYAGIVTEIASVGKNTAGTVNFIVTVEITSPGGEIKPGMTATEVISVDQAQEVLWVPTRAVRTQNGSLVVYLLKDGQPIPVAIQAGPIAGENTSVLAGALQEGDQVILDPIRLQ